MSAHTCINTATTANGQPPPPCVACQTEAGARHVLATQQHNGRAIFVNSLRTSVQAVAAANAIHHCRIALHDNPKLQDRLHGFEMMCFHRADELTKVREAGGALKRRTKKPAKRAKGR